MTICLVNSLQTLYTIYTYECMALANPGALYNTEGTFTGL